MSTSPQGPGPAAIPYTGWQLFLIVLAGTIAGNLLSTFLRAILRLIKWLLIVGVGVSIVGYIVTQYMPMLSQTVTDGIKNSDIGRQFMAVVYMVFTFIAVNTGGSGGGWQNINATGARPG